MKKTKSKLGRKAKKTPAIELNGKKIPMGGGIPLTLVQTQPNIMTPENLRAQLEAIGLACEDINDESLDRYIEEVRANIPHGKVETFRITKPTPKGQEFNFDKTESGSWDVADAAEMWIWGPILATIIEPSNFDLLKAADLTPPFCGEEYSDSHTEYTPTEEAVMMAFTDIATDASAVLVNGLDEADMEAALTNVIQAQDIELDDYYYEDDRLFYLLENYDPVGNEVDGLGAEAIHWSIGVDDYRNKDKNDPDNRSTIGVDCRAVLYGELFTLFRDLQYVMNQAKSHPTLSKKSFRSGIPMGPPDGGTIDLQVYDELPPADMDTFIHSLPSVQHDTYQDVTVLYLPELINVACLDNTQSTSSSDYGVQLTVGFSESNSLSFGYGASMSAGIRWLNTEFSFSSEISFTDQYGETRTETANFQVPAGQKAFIYQGRILTRTLRWTPPSGDGEGTYEYIDEDGQFLTKVYITSIDQQVAEPAPEPEP